MKYDPIKQSLGKVFNKSPFLRISFYKFLNLLLLRTWHIKKEIKIWAKNKYGVLNILDAGSGFGQYSYFLASYNKNWNITAVDVKKEQIQDCNNFFIKIDKKNVSFETFDLTKYIKKDAFDLILCVDVMEHILDDLRVFENFYHSMRKGAVLLISTPSDQGGSDVHDHNHDESFIEEHVRDGYNINSIQKKLKKVGFSKTEAKYTYGNPGKISWYISMKYPIQLLNVSKIFFILIPFYYLLILPFFLILNYFDVKNNHKTGTGLIVKAWK